MARYLPLFAIQVEHEFFAESLGSESLSLEFAPDKASAEMMQRANLLLRRCGTGIEIWGEDREVGSMGIANKLEVETTLDFVFLVSSSDPMFDFYTAWEMNKPVVFSGANADTSTVDKTNTQSLQMHTAKASDYGLSSFERQRESIVFSVKLQHKLQHRLPTGADAEMTRYMIHLKARPLHWKYYFCGALAKKQLQIVDLDRENDGGGTEFRPSPNVAGSNGQAFVSDAALPMRSIPSQRFQLREADATGRVLMRRLPNASIQKIGKEGAPDGQSLLVAEIYIHQ